MRITDTNESYNIASACFFDFFFLKTTVAENLFDLAANLRTITLDK